MEKTKNYITPGGLEKLRAEYADLLYGERPKVVETVAWAASNGDRSENADYIYGKRKLREIDRRLQWLTKRLENAEVVDPKTIQSTKIVFGATVEVMNEDEEVQRFQIVGEDETDIKAGKISWKSPLARALLGKAQGDEVTFNKPSGLEILTIEKVFYI